MHWYLRSRSMKSLKEEEGGAMGSNRRGSLGPRSLLERRWSAVSNAGNFRKKKRTTITTKPAKNEEPDYVRVPKTEFEEFKHRVSAIGESAANLGSDFQENSFRRKKNFVGVG